MSRFGGHAVNFGTGKASEKLLPEDQSLDNLLVNYAQEIIPNHFIISSYDAIPEYMGKYQWKTIKKDVFKLGDLEHDFTDLLLQYQASVTTSIYLGKHHYNNVYAVFIKTHKEGLEDHVPDYYESFDYVLQMLIQSVDEKPELDTIKLERILLILFYKMGLIYEDSITLFKRSKTHLGQMISEEFETTTINALVDLDSDDKLAELLKKRGNEQA
ncbi:hypothetical protein MED152_07315 [Polaribacter sp. MED152]|nr:hypothetical protein MED152_07315 [Polaribacter sp. MED152]